MKHHNPKPATIEPQPNTKGWHMITNLPKDELLTLGARYRANYLAEQAGYTLGLAAAEGQPLAFLLPEGYLTELKDAAEKMSDSAKDRALAEAESKEASKSQTAEMQRAKVWRRAVAHRALMAKRTGKEVPDGLTAYSSIKSVPAMAGKLEAMVKLLEANLASLYGSGLQELLAKGKSILEALRSVDAEQELKRLKSLPDAVREFYVSKGTVYIGIKAVNDAGHALYADQPDLSSRFNLIILYRTGGKRKAEETTIPGPVASR